LSLKLRALKKKRSLLVNYPSLQKEIRVHFVCTGNGYRSRLAEAYLKAKQIPKLHVSSSGIAAEQCYLKNGPICWDAMRLIFKYHLIPFMSPLWTQATSQLLTQTDIAIFMSQEHYQYAKDYLDYQDTYYQIWNIADMNGIPEWDSASLEWDIARITAAEHTFEQIRKKVDAFVDDIKYLDI